MNHACSTLEGSNLDVRLRTAGAMRLSVGERAMQLSRDAGAQRLATDLYPLNMLAACFEEGVTDLAVFEFAVRELPPGRNFLIAAGLESVLEFLGSARFGADKLDWLAGCGRLGRQFIDHLAGCRFTGDVEAAAAKLPALAQQLARDGIAIQAVRLDSGDLGEHARRVRRILDASGLGAVKIFASGDLDAWRLKKLAGRSTIDGYCVGTRVSTSADQPCLDCAYKLV